MIQKHKLGLQGEDLAFNYLTHRGYTIIATNYRYRRFEVDIIAQIANELVFVEVKTRTSIHFGLPESFVDQGQQQRLIECADHYLISNNLSLPVRFDIISITWVDGKPTLEHLENAFWPSV